MVQDSQLFCVETNNDQETKSWGVKCGQWLKNRHEVLSLIGDLGAGKTTFVQGVAIGLGIKEPVKSPTFVMLKEYNYNGGRLIHVDAYRLPSNFEDIGLEDYWGQANVLIEWAENIVGLLPANNINISFTHLAQTRRRICFAGILAGVMQ